MSLMYPKCMRTPPILYIVNEFNELWAIHICPTYHMHDLLYIVYSTILGIHYTYMPRPPYNVLFWKCLTYSTLP